jgi:hypothetical protein
MHSRVLFDKSKGKRPIGRLKDRWKDLNGYLKQKICYIDMSCFPVEKRNQWWILVNTSLNIWIS